MKITFEIHRPNTVVSKWWFFYSEGTIHWNWHMPEYKEYNWRILLRFLKCFMFEIIA